MTLAYSQPRPRVAIWQERSHELEDGLVKKLEELLPKEGRTLVPSLTPGAFELFTEFVDETRADNYPYRDYLDRVLNMVRIDVLMRTVFSGALEIHAPAMERAIAWGRHQLVLRSQLWPADRGSKVEVMEHCILQALRRQPSLSDIRLKNYCHVERPGAGGHETFNRAMRALMCTDDICVVGTTRKGRRVYAIHE